MPRKKTLAQTILLDKNGLPLSVPEYIKARQSGDEISISEKRQAGWPSRTEWGNLPKDNLNRVQLESLRELDKQEAAFYGKEGLKKAGNSANKERAKQAVDLRAALFNRYAALIGNRKYSNRRVAQLIFQKEGGSVNTLRRHIKKIRANIES